MHAAILCFLLGGFRVYSQDSTALRVPAGCHSHEYMLEQQSMHPGLAERIEAESRKLSGYPGNARTASPDFSTNTISVVFHVVYNTSAQNVPDGRLLEQLQVLNEDFNASNADIANVPSAFKPLIGNAGIRFCLAQRDPNDNPTSGITRTYTADTLFSIDDAVKYDSTGGCSIWNRDRYLNIWVCKLMGPVLGYTARPGSPASVDGAVIDYRYIGLSGSLAPYNLGHSVSHEIGHWFNLIHTWGDANCGNDLVNDTPKQQGPNYGTSGNCPSFPHVTCSNAPNGDMWMNFMDFGYDHCACFFTAGQCARMNAALNVNRPRLKSSNACQPLAIKEETGILGFSVYPNPAHENLNIDLSLLNTGNIQINVYNALGVRVLNKGIESHREGVIVLDVNDIPGGMYFLELITPHLTVNRKIQVQK